MGRHSDGKGNARVAVGPLILAVLAIVVIAAIVVTAIRWMNRNDDSGTAAGGCGRGDLTMTVEADPAVAETVRDLVFAYGETSPVVEDHCVRPQISVTGSERAVQDIVATANSRPGAPASGVPAVWVPASDELVSRADDDPAVTVAGPRTRLTPQPVGLAVAAAALPRFEGRPWAELGPAGEGIAAPGGNDAVVSSIAAAHLDPVSDPAAVQQAAVVRAQWTSPRNSDALLEELTSAAADAPVGAVAATPSMAAPHQGVTWIDPGDSTSIAAPVVSFGAGGGVDELTARAGADFIRFLTETTPEGIDPAGASQTDPGAWASPAGPQAERASAVQGAIAAVPAGPQDPPAPGAPAAPAGPQTPAAAAEGEGTGSALILVDASANSDLATVKDALRTRIPETSAGDGRTALWNYSSPVSPGVATPVRGNVWLAGASPEASLAALEAIGPVGEPWLWRSLPEAIWHAEDAWRPAGPNRVVLVSSGSDATADDAHGAVDALVSARDDARPVRVDVVVAGSDSTGGELERLADATGGSYAVAPAGNAEALGAALDAALGL